MKRGREGARRSDRAVNSSRGKRQFSSSSSAATRRSRRKGPSTSASRGISSVDAAGGFTSDHVSGPLAPAKGADDGCSSCIDDDSSSEGDAFSDSNGRVGEGVRRGEDAYVSSNDPTPTCEDHAAPMGGGLFGGQLSGDIAAQQNVSEENKQEGP